MENRLFLHNLQHVHGANLDANAAGDALGHGILFLVHHDLGGANLDALAAANAVLLVDHVHTGFGILGDGIVLANLHALAALNAHIGLCASALGHNLDAAVCLVKLLIERLGAGTDTFQASHALGILFTESFFIMKRLLCIFVIGETFCSYYTQKQKNSNAHFSADFQEKSRRIWIFPVSFHICWAYFL